jgi:hypothetical protein
MPESFQSTQRYSVTCDHTRCAETLSLAGERKTQGFFRTQAKTRGWKIATDAKHYCPAHATRHKRKRRHDITKDQ